MPYPKIDPKIRFLSRITVVGDCWEWTGAKDWDGYGILQLTKGNAAKAHRLSYEWFIGEIPDGLFVCHHCDNPSCVRPSHLFLGTQTDNKQDSARKGRLSGAYNPNSKLRKIYGKPEYVKSSTQPETTNSPQTGGGQPVQGAPSPAAGGGAGILPQQGGAGAVGGATGAEAPGGGRVNV